MVSALRVVTWWRPSRRNVKEEGWGAVPAEAGPRPGTTLFGEKISRDNTMPRQLGQGDWNTMELDKVQGS